MKRQLDQVLQFNTTFGCHMEADPTACPSAEVTDVRARLIEEELQEYRQATADGDLTKVADVLADLMYVLLGTYVAHGLYRQAEALFDEVHPSNMAKLGDDGQPILSEDGKILKPDNWEPPNLAAILGKE
jgi:predicted HAD superfamily Cof-like phosphohydrolase